MARKSKLPIYLIQAKSETIDVKLPAYSEWGSRRIMRLLKRIHSAEVKSKQLVVTITRPNHHVW